MGFFSRLFGRDTMKMVDMPDEEPQKSDPVEKNDAKTEDSSEKTSAEKSPFLDDGDADRPF